MAVQNDPAKAGDKALADNALSHPEVDPKAIPADTGRPGHPDARPDAGGNRLLAAAQAKAPSLTAEFVKHYKLSDEDLAAGRGAAAPVQRPALLRHRPAPDPGWLAGHPCRPKTRGRRQYSHRALTRVRLRAILPLTGADPARATAVPKDL
jgi:hypothetical protein